MTEEAGKGKEGGDSLEMGSLLNYIVKINWNKYKPIKF